MPASASVRSRFRQFRRACLALSLASLGLSAPARANDASDRFEAIAAFEEGRYEDALSALGRAPATSDLAYLRVRVLAELGRYDEALASSERPPRDLPEAVLRDLSELRVSWAANAGRCEALKEQSRAGTNRLSARCAFAARNFASVKELLASAKDVDSRALYVRALIELGEHEAARPLARAFYVEHPAHRDATRLRAFLQGRGELSLTFEERLARAEGLLAARQPEAALEELSRAPKPSERKRQAQLWHVRGEALFRTRKRYPEAQKAFARAAKLRGDTEEYDAFHAVRASSRAGKDRLAIKGYRAFAQRYRKSKLAPDAMFLAAWLSAREKLPSASLDLKHFVESKYGAQAPGLRRDALWELGFRAIEKRNGRVAAKWLEAYGKTLERPLDRARASYWQGRAALLQRDRAAARRLFGQALRDDRLGYYAQLAARRLVALGDPPPPAFEAAPSPLPRPNVKDLPEEVRFYRKLALCDAAGDSASRFLQHESDRMRRVAVLLETGDANRQFVAAEPLLERALEGPPDASRSWIWQALLPRPYLRIVLEQTQARELDPSLFYGHMQTESHYKPHVVSSADAIGLMQLLPETAAKVGEELGMKVTRGDLVRPHLNITLGAAYLASLVAHYKGQFPLAIAAYNAGTQKVDEWARRESGSELDRWVENIPVEQTRNYVRRVITAWSRYHAFTDPQHPWELPLPEKVRPATP